MSSNPTIITNVLSPNNPHITNFDPRERYVLQGILGEGGYGRVYQALDTVRQQLVAIKIIDLESAGDEVQDAHREIAVMANLHCPHLIQYYASYVINTNLWIVMEYLDAGSLLDIIKELGPLPESFIAYIIKEILLALQYLHHERKIHRDVKAGNLLVGSDGSVKLADFGVAGQLTDSVDKRQSKIGTPFWMAPEVITESKYDGGADIWSLGITAIELATGLPPYAQKVHPFRVILLIPKNPPPVLEGDFSETFKNFVASCLVKDPLQRPTATQLLEHPFVKDAVRSEGWKTFIAEKVMVNRYVPERDPSSELVRTGSNDSNCSNWNLTQKTAGSSSSRHRNAQIASSNSGNLNPSSSSFINVRTPRQGSISRGLAIENTNGFDDIIINSPRTPARNNSERNLEELMTINSHTPRGLMSPGHRQRQISSPRVPLPDDNLSLGGGSTRSRRGSGNSETLLILANNAGVSSVSSATASSGTGASNNNTSIAGSGKIHSNLMDSELTPPARVNPLRLPSTGFGINNSDQSFLPPLSNPSATNTNLIPEMIHVEPTSSLYRDMHSSISNSSSRDYDAGSSLHDSRSQFSSFIQNPNQSLLSIRGVNSSSSQQLLAGAKQGLSDASKAKSMPNMNSSLTSSGSIAFPSLNNGPQPGVLGQDELITYFQSWKQKEDYYLNEIHRLKEENLRLRSISKPFLSTVSVLVRNTNKVGGVAGEGSNANGGNVSSSSFDHYLGTGNNSHNNSSNQLAAIFHSMNSNANTNTNATTNGGPGGGTGSAGGGHLKSSSSFKDIQSILSISSDDTTPGPSRSLSPAAVVRDDIFADLASTHPNHPLLQRQLASAASSTNSLLMPQQAPPPPDELQTKALTDHPSEEKKGEDDEGGGKEDNEDILLRQSSFQLPPLPPAHHQSSNSGVPLTISVSQSYDDGNHHHYQNPNFLKSEETVPYPVPVIERGTAPVNGGARVMGYGIGDPSRSLDSVHPSSMIADPRSHSLDSADFETKHPTIKQLLKTPKFATTPTSSNNPSSSELQAQHRKFLETIVEHHLQQPSFVSTTSVTAESGTAPSTGGEGGSGTVASSSNSGKTNQSGSVGSRLMEAVIKPTLQEVKQRIERNIYTPEVVASNKTAEKKEGQDDANIGASEKAINKEAEIRKQQLENIWLLLATGFTALEKILSTPSAPSNDPSTTSTHNSGDPMQLSGTKDSTFKSVSVNGSEGSGSSSNMLVDFASLVTSFTLSELDEQP